MKEVAPKIKKSELMIRKHNKIASGPLPLPLFGTIINQHLPPEHVSTHRWNLPSTTTVAWQRERLRRFSHLHIIQLNTHYLNFVPDFLNGRRDVPIPVYYPDILHLGSKGHVSSCHMIIASNFAEEQVWKPLEALVSEVTYLETIGVPKVSDIETMFNKGISEIKLWDSREVRLLRDSNVGEPVLSADLQLRDNILHIIPRQAVCWSRVCCFVAPPLKLSSRVFCGSGEMLGIGATPCLRKVGGQWPCDYSK